MLYMILAVVFRKGETCLALTKQCPEFKHQAETKTSPLKGLQENPFSGFLAHKLAFGFNQRQ